MVRRFSIMMALGGLTLSGTASATAADLLALRAHIPFAFKAGDAILPAGHYLFRFDFIEQPGVLRVRDQYGHGAAFVLSRRADVPEGVGDEPKLVFEKKGSEYVLSNVLDPAIRFGIEVRKPRRRGEPERMDASTD